MLGNRNPAPPPPCLERRYASSQKGGTLIAESATDLATHQKLLSDPDGYRPAWCAGCGNTVLHAHDFRERTVTGKQGGPPVIIRRYECTKCAAIWRIVPRFIARCLWYDWPTVEGCCLDSPKPALAKVPERTQRRWTARLRMTALRLLQLLSTSGEVALEALASTLSLDSSRERLVVFYAQATGTASGLRLAGVAALVHRLGPGVRLM